MSDIILHHYPRSPFAEKIRNILGAKQLSWQSVTIPDIMPKPDVVALTGGYRKTPIVQIGADIFCDTALIAREIDARHPTPALYPADCAFTLAAATWADTVLFPACVTQVFQPHVIGNKFKSEAEAKAFLADRMALRDRGNARRIGPMEAEAIFHTTMTQLEQQLSDGRDYILGDISIVDFSTYHPCWFVKTSPPLEALFANYPKVQAWMARIDGLGHGTPTDLSSADAIAIANDSTPAALEATSLFERLPVGEIVEVAPTDYGVDPVQGELVYCDYQKVVIKREDERAGIVHVHFPQSGYLVSKVK